MAITADEWKKVDEFSLLGGPLHRLGRRWGLVRGKPVWLGFSLGVSCWAILMILACIEGHVRLVLSLSVIGGHIRLLLVIPLMFVCESAVDPTIRAFLRELVNSRVVPAHEVPTLVAALQRIRGWNEGRAVELACFLTAVLLLLLGTHLHLAGVTASYDPSHAMIRSSWTARWYWFVCLTLYRFLLLRWVWRMSLWCFLLLRISRLKLHLVAAHPDRMGGMGYLETVQVHFIPLVLASSAVQSASLAEQLARGEIAFEAIYPYALLTLAISSAVLLSPLFFFVPQLWACREEGWSTYLQLATRYVSAFDDKWVKGVPAEPLLGTSDLQSLADLGNSLRVVREMQWVPIPLTLLRDIGIAGIVPFLPLVLMKYPVTELAQRFLTRLASF